MGTQYKEVGGGPATGLADSLIKALTSGITGSFGSGTSAAQAGAANPVGSTQGIMGMLNNLFSPGAGNIGAAFSDLITKQETRDVNALRSRFGVGGGTAFGTPAAYSEALLRSETAPKLTQAIGGLQMEALGQILPLMGNLASKGISQRENIASPSPWATGASILGNVIGTGANIFSMFKMLNNLGKPEAPQLPALNIPNMTGGLQNSTRYPTPGIIRAPVGMAY